MFHAQCIARTASLEHALDIERQRVRDLTVRNDELLKQLLHKHHVEFTVPLPESPMTRTELPSVKAAPTERTEQWMSGSWFGSGGHSIATPPKESKVSAP